MDGLEFIKRLPNSHTKAYKVLITAYGNQDIYSEAQQIGVDECIPKPFTSDNLEALLQRMIE
jgi:DNA-binding NtrC family response regulator